MTTTTAATASRPTRVALDLDARLALVDAAMTVRLDEAAVAFEVNTAHLPDTGAIPHITAAPILPPAACPYTNPVAALLHDARVLLEERGWCAGSMHGEDRQLCLYGALRTAGAGGSHIDTAMTVLLEAIRRDFPDAVSVPAWNDAHGTARTATRYLDQAAGLAHDDRQ
jgi:hypothetical protein